MNDEVLLKFPLRVRIRESVFVANPRNGELVDDWRPVFGNGSTIGFFPCQVRLETQFENDLLGLHRAFLANRIRVAEEAGKLGFGIVAASSHPFADWRENSIVSLNAGVTASETSLTFSQRRALVNALHIDVEIDNIENARSILQYFEFLTYLSIPLTGSSPFWVGADSGYQSIVQTILGELPGSLFLPVEELVKNVELRPARFAEKILRRQSIGSRPLAFLDCGNVVISIRFDVPTDPRDVLVLLALLNFLMREKPRLALVSALTAPENQIVKRENYWRANKDGMNAIFVRDGGGEKFGLRSGLEELLESFAAITWPLPLAAVPAQFGAIVTCGNSAVKQRRVFYSWKEQGFPDLCALADVSLVLMAASQLTSSDSKVVVEPGCM